MATQPDPKPDAAEGMTATFVLDVIVQCAKNPDGGAAMYDILARYLAHHRAADLQTIEGLREKLRLRAGIVDSVACALQYGGTVEDNSLPELVRQLRTANAEQAARIEQWQREAESALESLRVGNETLVSLRSVIATLESQHAADVERIAELEQSLAHAVGTLAVSFTIPQFEQWFRQEHNVIPWDDTDEERLRVLKGLGAIASERKGGA